MPRRGREARRRSARGSRTPSGSAGSTGEAERAVYRRRRGRRSTRLGRALAAPARGRAVRPRRRADARGSSRARSPSWRRRAAQLGRYLRTLPPDPDRLEAIERAARRARRACKRKYGRTLDELLRTRDEARRRAGPGHRRGDGDAGGAGGGRPRRRGGRAAEWAGRLAVERRGVARDLERAASRRASARSRSTGRRFRVRFAEGDAAARPDGCGRGRVLPGGEPGRGAAAARARRVGRRAVAHHAGAEEPGGRATRTSGDAHLRRGRRRDRRRAWPRSSAGSSGSSAGRARCSRDAPAAHRGVCDAPHRWWRSGSCGAERSRRRRRSPSGARGRAGAHAGRCPRHARGAEHAQQLLRQGKSKPKVAAAAGK